MDNLDGKTGKTEDALPSKEGQPSGSEVSPSGAETYTRKQLEDFTSSKHAALDTRISSLEKEVKESQATVATKEAKLADVAEEREKLQTQIEELTSDDPKKFDLVKKDRDLRERERTLKADTQTLEAEKQTHAETVKLATETMREISIWEISTGYQGGDPVKLKDLCDISDAKTDEQIVKVADTMWAKKAQDPATLPITPFSGKGGGGAEDLSGLSPREKIERGIEEKKKKQT